jgi:cytochrome c553
MNVRLALGALIAAVLVHAPASAQTKPDIGKGQALAAKTCAACHNADGNSGIAQNPVLAGQGYDYLLKQLAAFKRAKGQDGARPNAIMSPQVAELSDQDLKDLSAYYAAQKPKGLSARNKELVGVGEKIFRGGLADRGVAACAGCHGPAGAGLPSQYPRLAGQHADYIEQQMKAWRVGERSNDQNSMMRMVAAKMSDREIKAVADYIAGLR